MKIIKVNRCGECPYFTTIEDNIKNTTTADSMDVWFKCILTNFTFRNYWYVIGNKQYINIIPYWCPLEDYKEAEDEKHP